MAQLTYGHVEGPGKGREYPIAASQYFHRLGGKFVLINSAGNASLLGSLNTYVAGWMEAPRDEFSGLKNSWMSDTTAKADKGFVIYGLEDVFEMPANQTAASVNATCVGHSAHPHNTGATYALIQQCKIDPAAAASVLVIVDYDSVNKTVFVKMKPHTKQAV